MVRQILVSTPPAAPAPSEGPDLGRWLTQELRAKGRPISSSPPSSPSEVGPEAPLAPVIVSDESPLVGWLARDLTPKHSVRPAASLDGPPPSSPASLPPEASEAAPPAALESEPSPARPPAPPTLEEDDFSVLPGRRRAAGSGRKKYALALLGLVLLGGALGLGLGNGGASGNAAELAGAASAADIPAALPPPPPASGALEPPPEPAPSAPAPRTGASREAPDELTDPRDPRFSLGGPNVRRYADVASPTLSRLAREQRRLAREREEAARNAKPVQLPTAEPSAAAERSSKR